MESNFYEERVPIPGFTLSYIPNYKVFGNIHTNIDVHEKENSLLFLHIKTLNMSDMRMPYFLSKNIVTPNFCFITFEYITTTNTDTGKTTTVLSTIFKEIAETSIFKNSSYVNSLDRYIELLNSCIDSYIALVKANTDANTKIDCRMLYGHFVINDNKLQFKYTLEKNAQQKANKIAVLGFNKPFVDNILKYFDIHAVKLGDSKFYYIRPAFQNRDINNDFVNIPVERTITAYRDTTEFFFHRNSIILYITNENPTIFGTAERGYVRNAFYFNLYKSHQEFDKYILLADKETSQLPVNYFLQIENVTDDDCYIEGEAEYIVLKDMFDQFNMFKLHVGDIYSADEYRELSYRKLMGLTANTVYLQNSTSTELLTRLLTRLFQHFPDTGGNQNNSLWQSIRDLVGDRETLEEIYKLLYHAYPCEPNGPQSKKLKIDF